MYEMIDDDGWWWLGRRVFITFRVSSKKGLRIFSVIWSIFSILFLWLLGVEVYEAWDSEKKMPKDGLMFLIVPVLSIPLHLLAFKSKDLFLKKKDR